jgi:hypothetical protein
MPHRSRSNRRRQTGGVGRANPGARRDARGEEGHHTGGQSDAKIFDEIVKGLKRAARAPEKRYDICDKKDSIEKKTELLWHAVQEFERKITH